MNEFRDLCTNCPSCHQEYQNELGIDIASKFVSFVRRQYPKDTQLQVESLDVKLGALSIICSTGGCNLSTKGKPEILPM